jgi:hypothetical protein
MISVMISPFLSEPSHTTQPRGVLMTRRLCSVRLGTSSLLASPGQRPAPPGLRRQRIALDDASSGDESDDQNDHRHHQQHVD